MGCTMKKVADLPRVRRRSRGGGGALVYSPIPGQRSAPPSRLTHRLRSSDLGPTRGEDHRPDRRRGVVAKGRPRGAPPVTTPSLPRRRRAGHGSLRCSSVPGRSPLVLPSGDPESLRWLRISPGSPRCCPLVPTIGRIPRGAGTTNASHLFRSASQSRKECFRHRHTASMTLGVYCLSSARASMSSVAAPFAGLVKDCVEQGERGTVLVGGVASCSVSPFPLGRTTTRRPPRRPSQTFAASGRQTSL